MEKYNFILESVKRSVSCVSFFYFKSFGSLIQPDKMWHPASEKHRDLVKEAHINYKTQTIIEKVKGLF